MPLVSIHADGKELARGHAEGATITDIVPTEGRGPSYGRWLQVTVMDGKNACQTVTMRVEGDTGASLTLHEPLPFG